MTTTNFNKEQLINVPIASETVQGLVERATDLEATTGSDTTRYITPKQAKDNYELKSDIINITIDTSLASGIITYSHGLGKIPKIIQLSSLWGFSGITCNGGYANNKNYSSYSYYTYSGGAVLNFGQSTTSSINHQNNTGSGQFGISGVIQNLTTTSFDIAWTKIGTSTGTVYLTATLIS